MTYRLVEKIQIDDDVEVILIDNGSSNELEKKIKEFIHTKYINPGKNLGFAGGVNRGIDNSLGEWMMLLNSDIDTDIAAIKTLIKKCKDKNVKVGIPKLVKSDGATEKNVGMFSSFFENPINWLFLRPHFILPDTDTKVQIATGGALLIHRSVIDKIGLLDDKNFFMYFEDIDYSLRLHTAGIDILYVPSSILTHVGGGSADKDPIQKKQDYCNSLNNYLLKYRGLIFLKLNSIFRFLK